MIDQVMTINSVQKSSKSELSSRFFGRLKILATCPKSIKITLADSDLRKSLSAFDSMLPPNQSLSPLQFHLLQSESPSTTKLNDLGVYLLVSLFFVVFAMLEFAVVLLVQRDLDSKRNHFVSQEKSNTETAFTKKGTTNTTINEMIGNGINEVQDIQKGFGKAWLYSGVSGM